MLLPEFRQHNASKRYKGFRKMCIKLLHDNGLFLAIDRNYRFPASIMYYYRKFEKIRVFKNEGHFSPFGTGNGSLPEMLVECAHSHPSR